MSGFFARPIAEVEALAGGFGYVGENEEYPRFGCYVGRLRPLHAADCPMTNERAEARTVCTCESIHKLGISDERDTPEGSR